MGEPSGTNRPGDESYRLEHTLDLYVHNSERKRQYVLALLDTGSDANLISMTQIRFLGFEYSKYTGRAYGGASGKVVPLGEADIYFHWAQSSTQKLPYEKFLVLEDLPFNMVLGKGFIEKNGVYRFNSSLLPFVWAP